MKKFLGNIWSYVSATPYRQMFAASLLISAVCLFVGIWAGTVAVRIAIACLGVATLCTMVDSIQTRQAFNDQIREMQEEHYKKYLDADKTDPAAIPLAFGPEEYRYIKKQRSGFVFSIAVKALILLTILVSFFA